MRRIVLAFAVAFAARAASAQTMKIGYVDVQRAIQEVEEGKAARSRLQAELAQKRAGLDKKRAALEKMKQEYDKQPPALAEDASRQRPAPTQRSIGEVAGAIGADLRGGPGQGAKISGVAPLETAGTPQIAFYANPRYRKELAATRAAAVIVSEDDAAHVPAGSARLVAAQPYVAFAKASALFHRELAVKPGIQPGALVDAIAEAHPTAAVSPGAYVGPGARIGARTTLHPGARVLDGARVGDDCPLWPGAVGRGPERRPASRTTSRMGRR